MHMPRTAIWVERSEAMSPGILESTRSRRGEPVRYRAGLHPVRGAELVQNV
jgi:hypothetical protein